MSFLKMNQVKLLGEEGLPGAAGLLARKDRNALFLVLART